MPCLNRRTFPPAVFVRGGRSMAEDLYPLYDFVRTTTPFFALMCSPAARECSKQKRERSGFLHLSQGFSLVHTVLQLRTRVH